MEMNVMKGTYYLMERETYGFGQRVLVKEKLTDAEMVTHPIPVKVCYGHGIFILLRDNEEASPLLLSTNGYISFA